MKVVESSKDIVEYVNNKVGGESRANDKITNFTYVGHATPGDLDVGYEEGGWRAVVNDKIEPSDFKSEAFDKSANVNCVAGCRTAVDGDLPGEKSVVDQFAEKLDPTS